MKMADVDINPFGEHDKTGEYPDTGETISFTQGGVIEGGSNLEPEQETSFERTSQRMKVLKEHFKALYNVLSKETGQTPEAFQFGNFEYMDGNCTTKARASP